MLIMKMKERKKMDGKREKYRRNEGEKWMKATKKKIERRKKIGL
jgi:hypothetical protein